MSITRSAPDDGIQNPRPGNPFLFLHHGLLALAAGALSIFTRSRRGRPEQVA